MSESLRIRKSYVGPFSFFSFGISLIFELAAGVAARFDTCARGSASLAAPPVLEGDAVDTATAVIFRAELNEEALFDAELDEAMAEAMAVIFGAELDKEPLDAELDEAMAEATATDATARELETSALPLPLTSSAKRAPGGKQLVPRVLPYLQTASRKAASKLPRAFAINPEIWYSKGRSLK